MHRFPVCILGFFFEVICQNPEKHFPPDSPLEGETIPGFIINTFKYLYDSFLLLEGYRLPVKEIGMKSLLYE